jgi:hypothetical protein
MLLKLQKNWHMPFFCTKNSLFNHKVSTGYKEIIMKRFHKLALVPAAIAATLAGNAHAGTTACFEVYKADTVAAHEVLYRNDTCIANSLRTGASATNLQKNTTAAVAYELTKNFNYSLETPMTVPGQALPVGEMEVQLVYIPTTNMGSRDRVTFTLSGPANWGTTNANQLHLFQVDENDSGDLVYKEVATSDGVFNSKQEVTFVFKAGVSVRAGQRLVWSRNVSADAKPYDADTATAGIQQDVGIVSPAIAIATPEVCGDDVEDVVLTATAAVTDGGNPIIGAADTSVTLVDIKSQFAINTTSKRGVTKANVNATSMMHNFQAQSYADAPAFGDFETHVNGENFGLAPRSRFVKNNIHDNVVWTQTFAEDTQEVSIASFSGGDVAGMDHTDGGLQTASYWTDRTFNEHVYGVGAVFALDFINNETDLDAAVVLGTNDTVGLRYTATGGTPTNTVVGLFDQWTGREDGPTEGLATTVPGWEWSAPAGTTDILYSAQNVFADSTMGGADEFFLGSAVERPTKYIALAHSNVAGRASSTAAMGFNYDVSVDVAINLAPRTGLELHKAGTCKTIKTHEISFDGAVLKAPYVYTEGGSNFVRLTNEGATAADVYMDIFDEAGNKVDNVMVGTIPAHASTVLWSNILKKRADAAGYEGVGARHTMIFNVMAKKEDVNGVSLQRVPGGVDRVMPVIDQNTFSQ